MKKRIQFIKKNSKILLLGILIGSIISGVGTYAAVTLASSSVSYDNTTSGAEATDVKGAIDELYSLANYGCKKGLTKENETVAGYECKLPLLTMEKMCPNCVFASGNISFENGGSYQNTIKWATKVSSDYKEFTGEYTAFVGFGLDETDNDTIKNIYLCAYTTDKKTPFCLHSSSDSLTNEERFNNNLAILNALTNNGCRITDDGYSIVVDSCPGVNVSMASYGSGIRVSGENYSCNSSNCID